MATNFDLKAIKDSADIVLKRKTPTGSKTVLMCDYSQKTDMMVKADAVYARAKGVKKVKFNKPKEGNIKME